MLFSGNNFQTMFIIIIIIIIIILCHFLSTTPEQNSWCVNKRYIILCYIKTGHKVFRAFLYLLRPVSSRIKWPNTKNEKQ